ncbi:DUF5753 domain-containing protein [Nocardia bovistercoris]|uniref:Transcriptional regulator n=1 Tax=Nocardia bovistercoris TaxID=2785916 RepID=A0A931MZS5_9NOCA|nr:DUF5753 domain-containing protein [Nocardia bovistercoris]MBH0776465.1 transcriptional regulator [Nocardia bovistercoris]
MGARDMPESSRYADREAIAEAARRVVGAGWWQRDADWLPPGFDTYLHLEQAARLLRCYECRVVPELLQTPDYARALLTLAHPEDSEAMRERRVALRMRRAEILTRREPVQLWAIIEESALRRPVGGSAVWRAQLEHLSHAAAQYPNVAVQVLADPVGGPAVAEGSFSVLRFAEGDLPDLVYLQQLTRRVFLDASADIEAYMGVADILSVHAMAPEHTPALIEAMCSSQPRTVDEPNPR